MVDKSNCDNNGGASQVGQVPMLVTDSGREARVSRYREKRRTRLFSKKIRYEVRKLNAERRPRMKVCHSCFRQSSLFLGYTSKL